MNNISGLINPIYEPPSNIIHINRIITFNNKKHQNLRLVLGDLKNTILISKPEIFKEFTKRKRKIENNA